MQLNYDLIRLIFRICSNDIKFNISLLNRFCNHFFKYEIFYNSLSLIHFSRHNLIHNIKYVLENQQRYIKSKSDENILIETSRYGSEEAFKLLYVESSSGSIIGLSMKFQHDECVLIIWIHRRSVNMFEYLKDKIELNRQCLENIVQFEEYNDMLSEKEYIFNFIDCHFYNKKLLLEYFDSEYENDRTIKDFAKIICVDRNTVLVSNFLDNVLKYYGNSCSDSYDYEQLFP